LTAQNYVGSVTLSLTTVK